MQLPSSSLQFRSSSPANTANSRSYDDSEGGVYFDPCRSEASSAAGFDEIERKIDAVKISLSALATSVCLEELAATLDTIGDILKSGEPLQKGLVLKELIDFFIQMADRKGLSIDPCERREKEQSISEIKLRIRQWNNNLYLVDVQFRDEHIKKLMSGLNELNSISNTPVRCTTGLDAKEFILKLHFRDAQTCFDQVSPIELPRIFTAMDEVFKHGNPSQKATIWIHLFKSYTAFCDEGDAASHILSAVEDVIAEMVSRIQEWNEKEYFTNMDFQGRKLEHLNLYFEDPDTHQPFNLKMRNCNFNNAILYQVDFKATDLSGSTIVGVTLRKVDCSTHFFDKQIVDSPKVPEKKIIPLPVGGDSSTSEHVPAVKKVRKVSQDYSHIHDKPAADHKRSRRCVIF